MITGGSLWENVHCISILLYLIRPKKGKEQGSGGQKRCPASHAFMEEAPMMFEGVKMYSRGVEAPRVIQTPEKQCFKRGLNFSQRFLAANEPSSCSSIFCSVNLYLCFRDKVSSILQ